MNSETEERENTLATHRPVSHQTHSLGALALSIIYSYMFPSSCTLPHSDREMGRGEERQAERELQERKKERKVMRWCVTKNSLHNRQKDAEEEEEKRVRERKREGGLKEG